MPMSPQPLLPCLSPPSPLSRPSNFQCFPSPNSTVLESYSVCVCVFCSAGRLCYFILVVVSVVYLFLLLKSILCSLLFFFAYLMHKVFKLFYLTWEKATLDSVHILPLAKDIWSVVTWGKYIQAP